MAVSDTHSGIYSKTVVMDAQETGKKPILLLCMPRAHVVKLADRLKELFPGFQRILDVKTAYVSKWSEIYDERTLGEASAVKAYRILQTADEEKQPVGIMVLGAGDLELPPDVEQKHMGGVLHEKIRKADPASVFSTHKSYLLHVADNPNQWMRTYEGKVVDACICPKKSLKKGALGDLAQNPLPDMDACIETTAQFIVSKIKSGKFIGKEQQLGGPIT